MIQIIVRIVPGGDKRRAYEQAVAEVSNLSNLAEFSDYAVSAGENQNGVTGAAEWSARFRIYGHDRLSSVWTLVSKVANACALEAEKASKR